MKIFENIEDVKAIRKKTGMNQIDFWGKVGLLNPEVHATKPAARCPNPYANCSASSISNASIWQKSTKKIWKSPPC